MGKEQRGSAEMLAIFTVFVILSGVVALNTFESGYLRQMNALQQRMAVDTTKAVSSAVEAELNDSLGTAISAAMFEVGKFAGTKADVEARMRTYFNQRIAAGWSYSNFDEIYVPFSDDNSLRVEWLPDGGVRAYGYLNASFKHVMGSKAFGVKLDAGVAPRYGRMLYLANFAYSQALHASDIVAFENELNDNYFAERFSFYIYRENGVLKLTLNELYGGRVIASENEG
ncbi:MAG: hypothetical protein ABH852_01035 [Methanobacteriota archaeon]